MWRRFLLKNGKACSRPERAFVPIAISDALEATCLTTNVVRLRGLIALFWSVVTSPRSCAASRQIAYDD
jgi:hypothetical protein